MANKENISKLVNALRSDKYTQSRYSLRDDFGFCCLGIACDISGIDKWAYINDGYFYDGMHDILPLKVVEWLGLDSRNPAISTNENDDFTTMAGLNDTGTPFSKIADLLEEKYLKGEYAK